MEILRREFDVSNKYRVTLTADGINTFQLKFNSEVTDQEVITLANEIISSSIAEEARIAALEAEEQQLLNELGGYGDN